MNTFSIKGGQWAKEITLIKHKSNKSFNEN